MSDSAATTPEVELASLRILYGAKFNAITAALGYVSSARAALEEGDDDRCGSYLEQAERILVDA